MDYGHELTEEMLAKLEKKIEREYKQATKEATEKLEQYLMETEQKRQIQEALYKAGKITKKEYTDWCYRHTMMGKRWEEMRDVLAEDFHNTNKIALKIAKGKMPDVYALNGNYATYQIEHDGKLDTGFTLYNHDTAEYLLKEQRELMPGPSTRKQKEIAANKDMQWNKNKIQSTVLQGVLQGESPYSVAKRLQNVGQMNYNASVRYARTMTTNAQNAGRYQAFERAKKVGVDLVIEWEATLDNRTRHEHRMMHGQRREVGEPFEVDGVKIMWPGNDKCGSSTVPQDMIWNCRCTLLSWVKGFEGETVKTSPKMEGMTFEEWQKDKAPKPGKKQRRASSFTSNGKPVIVKENIGYTEGVKSVKDRIAANGGVITEQDLKDAGSYLTKEYEAFAKDRSFIKGEDCADWLADKLSQVRAVGSDGIDLKSHLDQTKSPHKKNVIYAYSHYPRDWVEKSVAYDKIAIGSWKRGYYQSGFDNWMGRHINSEIKIDSQGMRCIFHELGHRFEHVVDGIADAEKAFYDRRTQGEPLEWLGSGYKKSEKSRKDKFYSAYIGKEYPNVYEYNGTKRNGYEIVSMGFEDAYTRPKSLAIDPEMQNLIYGILLLL